MERTACTVAIWNGLVIASDVSGMIHCLDARTGKRYWSCKTDSNIFTSPLKDFGSEYPHWGYCDHPLIDGDRLICAPSGKEATMAALDKRSGKVLWKTIVPEGGSDQGYGAISLSEAGGIRQYVVFTAKGVMGVAAADGKLLWKYDGLSNPIPCG
jgi:outer membrane protein assembly factor BamB